MACYGFNDNYIAERVLIPFLQKITFLISILTWLKNTKENINHKKEVL